MKNNRQLLVIWVIKFLLSINIQRNNAHSSQKMNVLLIVADDLRTTLSCYGDTVVKTPNLDSLASRSVLFTTVASQQAVCAPSRTSFLTSRRPDTTKLYSNKDAFYWRDKVGNFSTLPQYFKEAGYFTASVGKVFHPGSSSNKTFDYPYSWSVPPYIPSTLKYDNAKVCPNDDGTLHTNLICPVDVAKQPERTLPDIQNTRYALHLLQQFSSSQPKTPFFLAVGFYKPHISFKYPKEFLDLYPLDKVPVATDPFLPLFMPKVAYEPWTDIRWREDVAALNLSFPYGPMPKSFARKIRQNYYAATSYVDSLIGDLLEGIQKHGFSQNTVVVVIGDHGWALGEHDEWCKYSNFRVATNVPLIVHVPNLDTKKPQKTRSGGIVSDMLVELVDIMPSLADICGLKKVERCPKESSKVSTCTEGLSFYPLLKDPSLPWKKAIFSQYPRPSENPSINTCLPKPQDIRIMGYSMQTTEHRYTEWIEFDPVTMRGNWSNVHARELYITRKEDKNVANLPEFAVIVKMLSDQLKKGWMGALPDRGVAFPSKPFA